MSWSSFLSFWTFWNLMKTTSFSWFSIWCSHFDFSLHLSMELFSCSLNNCYNSLCKLTQLLQMYPRWFLIEITLFGKREVLYMLDGHLFYTCSMWFFYLSSSLIHLSCMEIFNVIIDSSSGSIFFFLFFAVLWKCIFSVTLIINLKYEITRQNLLGLSKIL